MASEVESNADTDPENQEERLQDLTDEQLEQLLYDTLLVIYIMCAWFLVAI